MSDYTVTFDGAGKDALSSGNAAKVAKGADLDTEFDNIATAILSKYDSNDLASQAAAEAGTNNATIMTPLRVEQWSAVWAAENAGMIGDIQALADPNADQILFWDDGAGAVAGLTLSTGLTFSGTVLTLDAQLQDISALGVTANNFLMANGANWTLVAEAAIKSALNLEIGTDVQAWDANLDQLAALAVTNSNFIVGNGSAWVAESGATARTSLGVGTGDSPQFTGINLGHASDTTLSRAAAGKLNIEGKAAIKHTGAYTSGEVTFSTSAASGGTSGDIWFRYV
jgi:hypothetical protein